MPTNIAVFLTFLSLFAILQAQSVDPFFTKSDCGRTKQCIFKPDNCVPYIDCSYAFSYRVDGENLIIELLGKVKSENSSWIAVGFSNDSVMGRDSLVTCGAQFSDGNYSGRLTYNPGKSNRPVFIPQEIMDEMVQTIYTNYSNNTLYCLLSRKIVPVNGVNPNEVFDLSNPKYVLLASGLIENEYVRVHDMDPDHSTFPFVSQNPINLIDRSKRQSPNYQLNVQPSNDHTVQLSGNANSGIAGNNITGHQFLASQQQNAGIPQNQQQFQPPPNLPVGLTAKKQSDLLKVHAILMIIAWVFFLPIGVMFGTFFKYHWPNTYIFRKNIWFQAHRVFNLIGIACTIAAFVCIFVREDWQWIGPSPTKSTFENNQWPSVHAMLGLLACVVAWAQPLNAVFRCHPTSAWRWIFKFYHGFFGFGAFLMATAAIMIAVKHFKTVFTNSDAALGIYIAFVATFGAVFVILWFLDIGSWWQRRRNVVATDMELVQVDGKRHVTLTPATVRTHRIYFVLLLFFAGVALGATIAISILIGLRKVQTFQ
uniref:ascorbate ferrireductase (transmembrane) n=1 Tax=Panagrolaimus superbus TaxID=310955 RepID=A0A914YHW5_9BILA